MTSKNLFFNLMKEDLRRRLWAIILASIVFFFFMPVATIMFLQHYLNAATGSYIEAAVKEQWIERAREVIGGYFGTPANILFVFIAGVGAIICGISGYAFLHSKKQVDFYHSLPVKRETIFFIHFVDGILIYLIPYTVGMLLSMLLCLLFGVATGKLLLMCLGGLLLFFVIFLSFYMFAILATLLTGKMLITLFGVAVLFLYVPLLDALIGAYKGAFLSTLYEGFSASGNLSALTKWFSPISQYWWMLIQYENGSSLWPIILGFVIFSAILLVLCVFLYKKRKSEKAGIAMAFAVSEPIIRILIAVPVGLGFGMVLLMIQATSQNTSAALWLGFGTIIGAFLAHGVIESLYQFDVKKCLSHKFQLLGTVVVTTAIAMSFFFDWFRFDSYLPKKEEVRAMAVNCYEMVKPQDYYENEAYTNGMEYTIEHMALESFDAAYEIAKLCSTHAAEVRGDSDFTWPEDSYPTSIVIKYELRNGKSVYRKYVYNAYEIMDLLAELYRQEEYKKQNYQILKLSELGAVVTDIDCIKEMKQVNLTLSEAEREELLALYQKELMELEFSELVTTPPVGYMNVEAAMPDRKYPDARCTYQAYLYPSMAETLGFLSRHGFDVNRIATAEEVEAIYIGSRYRTDEFEITEPAEIAECMKYLVHSDLANVVPFQDGYYFSADVIFTIDDYGNQWRGYYYFTELPDFIKERAGWQDEQN